jgi:hypothetical protein
MSRLKNNTNLFHFVKELSMVCASTSGSSLLDAGPYCVSNSAGNVRRLS